MSAAAGPDIVEDGLVLCLDAANERSYPGSGATWSDLSGNGNDGTLVNGVGYDSVNNGSMVFDGTNTYVDIDNTNVLTDISSGGFTLCVWAFIGSPIGNNAGLFSGASAGGSDIGIVLSNSQSWVGTSSIEQGIGGSGTFDSYQGEWCFACFSRSNDGTTLTLSINLQERYSPTVSSPVSLTSNSIYLGQRYNNKLEYDFNGNMGNVSLYNRALTEAEIKQNFNAFRGRYGI